MQSKGKTLCSQLLVLVAAVAAVAVAERDTGLLMKKSVKTGGALYIGSSTEPSPHVFMGGTSNEAVYEFFFTRNLKAQYPWLLGETYLRADDSGELHWHETYIGPGRAPGRRMYFTGASARDRDGDGLGDG